MGNTGVKLGTIAQNVHYPSVMIHDPTASAMAELWLDHALSDGGLRLSWKCAPAAR